MGNLTARLHASIAASYSNPSGLAPVSASRPASAEVSIDTGTGDYQSDLLYAETRTLLTGAADNLDLAGALVDKLGSTIAMVEVTAILIESRAANTTNLTVGNGANPFVGPFGAGTHTLQLQPGGAIMLTAPKTGWTVTAATADILKITNAAGASATYDITILGRSA